MLSKLGNALGKQGNLHIRRTGIGFVAFVFGNYLAFNFLIERPDVCFSLSKLFQQESFNILALSSEEGHYGLDEIRQYLSDPEIQRVYNNLEGDEIIMIAEKKIDASI